MLDKLDGEVNLDQIDATSLNYWKMRCKTQLDNLLLVYYKKFKELLPEPQLVFDLDSRTIAGQAVYPNKIRINLKFLLQEREHYIENVVGHELAHYIVFHFIERKLIKSRAVKPHGAEWRALMYLFGIEPNVYHTYDVEPREGTLRYLCNCKVHWLTKIRHNRCQKGTQYYCKKCGSLIKYQPDESVQPGEQTHKIYKKVRGAAQKLQVPQAPQATQAHQATQTKNSAAAYVADLQSPAEQSTGNAGSDTGFPPSLNAQTSLMRAGISSSVGQGLETTADLSGLFDESGATDSHLDQSRASVGGSAAVIGSETLTGTTSSSTTGMPTAVVTSHGFTMPLAKGVKLLRPQGPITAGVAGDGGNGGNIDNSGNGSHNANPRVADQGSGATATAQTTTAKPTSAPSAYRRQQKRQAIEALDNNDTFLGYLQDTGVSSLNSLAKQLVNSREKSVTRSRKK